MNTLCDCKTKKTISKNLRLRCESIKRRARDLRELGIHRPAKKSGAKPKNKRRGKREASDEYESGRQMTQEDVFNYVQSLYSLGDTAREGGALLSRQKRQDFSGGLLKDLFGVAYSADIHNLKNKLTEAEDRLAIQVRS